MSDLSSGSGGDSIGLRQRPRRGRQTTPKSKTQRPTDRHGLPHADPRPSLQSTTFSVTGERLARLAQTIEAEIIPRLLLANSTPPSQTCAGYDEATIDDATIDDLAVLTVRGSLLDASRFVEAIRAQGVALEIIFLRLLAPTARRLGKAWEDDTLSFSDVTIGLGKLQELLRQLCPAFEFRQSSPPTGNRIMLLQAPGEHHTFGLFMIEAFFRRAGWEAVCAASLPFPETLSILSREWVDIVGVSKSSDTLLDGLASDITAIRRASCNKDVTIMVGGPAFLGHPERVILVGADVSAADGQQAVWQANQCVRSTAVR